MSATAETTIDSQASHDRESGGPSSAAKSAFSHEKDADAHPETRDLSKAEPGSVEALASGTSAQNEPSNKFTASLDAAKEAQESSGSTAI